MTDVIYEDADIVVVNKDASVIVHRAPGYETLSLADSLAATRPGMKSAGSAERPGVVHRLDIETSGVMVFAKTPRAYRTLRADFESHAKIEKTYLAVLHGTIVPAEGRLETLIGRKPWDKKRMAVVESGGRRAVTKWRVLQKQGPISLVEFRIETGRTHQIRVHAAHLGHPIAGDALYGDRVKDSRLRHKPSRHLLHAVELAFPHPVTGEYMSFAAPPPADIIYAG